MSLSRLNQSKNSVIGFFLDLIFMWLFFFICFCVFAIWMSKRLWTKTVAPKTRTQLGFPHSNAILMIFWLRYLSLRRIKSVHTKRYPSNEREEFYCFTHFLEYRSVFIAHLIPYSLLIDRICSSSKYHWLDLNVSIQC